MECHTCSHFRKHDGEPWEKTPCASCRLVEDSSQTLEYDAGRSDTADPATSWEEPDDRTEPVSDNQPPFAFEDGASADPLIPMSVLASAMALWIRLSLPARKALLMRLQYLPYEKIGQRLGCSRQAVEKLLAQAIAKDPVLGALLPGKKRRRLW